MSGDREQIERCAKAAYYAFGHDVTPSGVIPWDQAPEDFRITFRMVADAVLMTASETTREPTDD